MIWMMRTASMVGGDGTSLLSPRVWLAGSAAEESILVMRMGMRYTRAKWDVGG